MSKRFKSTLPIKRSHPKLNLSLDMKYDGADLRPNYSFIDKFLPENLEEFWRSNKMKTPDKLLPRITEISKASKVSGTSFEIIPGACTPKSRKIVLTTELKQESPFQ